MSEQMPIQLTDDLIERMLRDRAGVGAPADLSAGIVRVVGDTKQRPRSWLAMPGLRERSRQRLVLVAGLLALVLLSAAILLVGSKLQADRRVEPPPPAPSQASVATDAPSPSPSPSPSPNAEPSVTPEPTTSPTGISETCGSTPPTDTPRVTVIDLPSHAYLGVTFAACSVWVTNNQNGRGIHEVDLARSRVVRTVMKRPIQNPVYAVRSDGDELWTITWGDPIKLERIDPSTGKPDRSFTSPIADLGGGVWILGKHAWAGPGSRQRSDTARMDLETGDVSGTIDDLVPYEMWRDSSAVWAIARPSAADTNAKEDDVDLVRIDPTTLDVTRIRLAREATKDGIQATVHSGALFFTGPAEIRQVSLESGEIVRRIPIAHADMGVTLASTGSELWALPIESASVSSGWDNRSRQLVRIDPATGAVLRRVPLRERGVMGLSYGFGSLWVLAPDADYGRTFGMHLIRVELPSDG